MLWDREEETVSLHGGHQGRFPSGDNAWDISCKVFWLWRNIIFKVMEVGVAKSQEGVFEGRLVLWYTWNTVCDSTERQESLGQDNGGLVSRQQLRHLEGMTWSNVSIQIIAMSRAIWS